MTVMSVKDIVEANGKTVEVNNLSKKHEIPLYSLVEIRADDESDRGDDVGLRLWVVNHGRDCDGTILYALSFKKDAYENMMKNKALIEAGEFEDKMDEAITRFHYTSASAMILGSYSKESLKVISSPD